VTGCSLQPALRWRGARSGRWRGRCVRRRNDAFPRRQNADRSAAGRMPAVRRRSAAIILAAGGEADSSGRLPGGGASEGRFTRSPGRQNAARPAAGRMPAVRRSVDEGYNGSRAGMRAETGKGRRNVLRPFRLICLRMAAVSGLFHASTGAGEEAVVHLEHQDVEAGAVVDCKRRTSLEGGGNGADGLATTGVFP